MKHLHKRFVTGQVKILFATYLKGRMSSIEVMDELGIGKTQFFAWLKIYRQNPDNFSLSYKRTTPKRLIKNEEEAIKKGLLFEKRLIEDPSLPITHYNYSALKDRLLNKAGVKVSLTTIIKKAKEFDCYLTKRKGGKVHDREVVTMSPGALIQHDASIHFWSPYATEKWVLITSLDDFSRKLLFAGLIERETTWEHIKAVEVICRAWGFPLRYYVDQLRIFRFVQGRDSIWRKHILQTDDADPQWRTMMRKAGIDVTYALSPQAKGKIERPYQWLQDRIVRTCAIEHITTIQQAREVLKEEVQRYNARQVHSTTKEIPDIRFTKALRSGNSLFRPFTLPAPYTNARDIFCLRERRMVNSYHKISLWSKEIFVPKVTLRDDVDIHIIPDWKTNTVELRFWWKNQLVHTLIYPINTFPTVQF